MLDICRYIANRLGLDALTDAAFHHGADETDFEKYVTTSVRLPATHRCQ